MKPISEIVGRYKSVYAASQNLGVSAKLLHENIKRGALVEPDGTIWIRSKTKLNLKGEEDE